MYLRREIEKELIDLVNYYPVIYIKKILKNRIQKGYIVYTGTHEQRLKEFNFINYKKVSSLINYKHYFRTL